MKGCSLQTNCNQPNFLLSRVHTCCSNWRDVINKGRDGYQLKQARLNHINPEQVKGFNFQNNFGLNAFEMGRLLHWGSSWSNLSFIVRPELSSPYRNKEAWQFSGCNQNCWDKGNCKKLKGPVTITRRATVSRLYVINQLSLSGWGGVHSLRLCPWPLSPPAAAAGSSQEPLLWAIRKRLVPKHHGGGHPTHTPPQTRWLTQTWTEGLDRHPQRKAAGASDGQKGLNSWERVCRRGIWFSWAIIWMIFYATKWKSSSKTNKQNPSSRLWIKRSNF